MGEVRIMGQKQDAKGEREQTKELLFLVFSSNHSREKMDVSDENMIKWEISASFYVQTLETNCCHPW